MFLDDKLDSVEEMYRLQNLKGDDKYTALNEIIKKCNRIVFFGGAGVSTESGIPDFRSKDGLYNQHDVRFDMYQPEYLLSRDCLYHNPKVFYEFYRQKMNVEGIEPNEAHKKLAELEAAGKLSGIITQNIDGLHQKAGSKNVQEIHGTTLRNYCVKCKKEYPADFIFKSEDLIPKCPECGRMVRPDVTLYGEALPKYAWANSISMLTMADCFIVGGTSLTVYPAASLISYYGGRYLIIINRSETGYDKWAHLVFRENIGDVMKRIEI